MLARDPKHFEASLQFSKSVMLRVKATLDFLLD